MLISIAKLERDGYIHIFYYIVLYMALIITIINLLKIDNLKIYVQVIAVIFLLFSVLNFILFVKKHISYYINERYLRNYGVRIKAVLDKKEFSVSSDRIMQVCSLLAYYTKDEKTYIFKDDIWYFGFPISTVLVKLKKEEGLLSDVDVLVDPNNYNKYIVLKYNYLYNLFEANMMN